MLARYRALFINQSYAYWPIAAGQILAGAGQLRWRRWTVRLQIVVKCLAVCTKVFGATLSAVLDSEAAAGTGWH